MEPILLQTSEADAGTRLDTCLARAIEDLTRSAAAKAVEDGRVLVNGKVPNKSYKLTGHEQIEFLRLVEVPPGKQRREHRRAVDLMRRALELVRRGGLTVEVAELLTALAVAENRLGRHAAAARHLAEARNVLDTAPDPGHLLADPRTTASTG